MVVNLYLYLYNKLHSQINPIRLIWLVFKYQICLTSKSDENDYLLSEHRGALRTHSNIEDGAFSKYIIAWKSLTFFAKSSILDKWVGTKYASGTSKVTLHKCARKGKHLRKNENQNSKKGIVSCKRMRKSVWPNS